MNTRACYDLIVVGGGIAGYHTAFSARDADPGMKILVISAETTPTYSAPSLPDYVSGHIPREKVFVAREEDFEARRIELRLNQRVTSADPEAKTLTTEKGEVLAYRRLVLATGSVPIRLRRMPGTSLPGNHVLRTVADAEALASAPAKRAVVVGTGAIGLEGASALRERGVEEVTLVEALEWINPKCFDRRASDYMTAELERIGVRVLLGEGIVSVEGNDRVSGVRTAKRAIPCDLVLWGIGMRPVVDLAVSMGAALGEHGGIRIDAQMRTSLPDVYAVGDCTEPYDLFYRKNMPNMLWRTATEQGMLLGSLLGGGQAEDYEGAKLLFLTYVGDAPACACGYPESALKGQRYTVLEDCGPGGYRKVLLQRRRIVGFQMVNTLEGANELYAQMLKGEPVELAAGLERDPVRFPLKSVALSAYLARMERVRPAE